MLRPGDKAVLDVQRTSFRIIDRPEALDQYRCVRMAIEHIVFDLGNVLFRFSFDPFLSYLSEWGGHFSGIEDFRAKTNEVDYERGRITSGQFLEGIAGYLSRTPPLPELARRWQDIFTPIEEMIALQQCLRGRYRTFILSNTNELHWKFLSENYALQSLADASLASFQVGAMKPSLDIFREAGKRFGLEPARTVLIDDLESNALGAVRAGWQAITHLDRQQTSKRLAALGVE